MKKINFNIWAILLAIVVLGASSCEKEYEMPDGAAEGNELFLSTSFGIGNAVEIQNGQEMYFDDFSSGVRSITWTFPAEAGPSIASSTDKHVRVSFATPGDYEVGVHVEFNGNYKDGETIVESMVYDGTIDITVLADLAAVPAITDEYGTVLTNSANAKNKVEAGSDVVFEDGSAGDPGTVIYRLTNKQSGEVTDFIPTEADNTFSFIYMGMYDLTQIIARTTLREQYADTVHYTDYFEVGPSSKPLLMNGVEVTGNVATIICSRVLSAPSSVTNSAVSLTVTNLGNPVDGITVTDVSVDSDEPYKLNLTLSEPTYTSDDILISYNASAGDIRSLDGADLASFTDARAKMTNLENLLIKDEFDPTLEDSENSNFAYAWWGGVWGMYNQNNNISSTRAFSGSQSFYIDLQAAGNAAINVRDNLGNNMSVPVEEGVTYQGTAWVYIESAGDAAAGPGFDFFETASWSAAILAYRWWGGEPTGQWIKISSTFTASSTGDLPFVMRGLNEASTVPHQMYIDDLSFHVYEPRP